MKRFKELSAGKKAGIFFAAVLAAALVLGGVSSIKAKIRAARRAELPTVVFTELSPETLKLGRTAVTPLENGDLRVTYQAREISEPEDVRSILELLDGAKLKALTPYADWLNAHPEEREYAPPSPHVGVELEVEGLYMQISIDSARKESMARVLVISKGELAEWVFTADEQGLARLYDGLWEHEGGKVLRGGTEVVHAAKRE